MLHITELIVKLYLCRCRFFIQFVSNYNYITPCNCLNRINFNKDKLSPCQINMALSGLKENDILTIDGTKYRG